MNENIMELIIDKNSDTFKKNLVVKENPLYMNTIFIICL